MEKNESIVQPVRVKFQHLDFQTNNFHFNHYYNRYYDLYMRERFMDKQINMWLSKCTLGLFTAGFLGACVEFPLIAFLSFGINTVSRKSLKMTDKCSCRNLTS